MSRLSLGAGAAIVLIANAFGLIHGARNRWGSPDAEVTLTNHELHYSTFSPFEENSGVTLVLVWEDRKYLAPAELNWLDQPMLQKLGFDCTVSPASKDAPRFYQRQRPRVAYVALEYDGEAYRTWLESYKRKVEERQGKAGSAVPIDYFQESSHLAAIDADRNAGKLRERHPDRANVIIVPAVIAIILQPYPLGRITPEARRSVRISGSLELLPSSIHVPRPLSDAFRRLDRHEISKKGLTYRVKLTYGALHEPWVTAVEFTNP